MKVVLDTNVIVSAFLSPGGNCVAILHMVLRRDVEICTSTAILAEYEGVLSRPRFAGQAQGTRRFFEILYGIGRSTECIPSRIDMPDESDRKFYDTAKAQNAILVTGNIKHYPKEPFIMTPAMFLAYRLI